MTCVTILSIATTRTDGTSDVLQEGRAGNDGRSVRACGVGGARLSFAPEVSCWMADGY